MNVALTTPSKPLPSDNKNPVRSSSRVASPNQPPNDKPAAESSDSDEELQTKDKSQLTAAKLSVKKEKSHARRKRAIEDEGTKELSSQMKCIVWS